MPRKFLDQQPGEVLTFCEGYKPLNDANKILKPYGLALRYRGHQDMGDQVFLRVEELPRPADDDLYNRIIAAAERHGRVDDPDHEVGDLQDCLRAALGLMSRDQLDRLAAHDDVRNVFTNAYGEEEPTDAQPRNPNP